MESAGSPAKEAGTVSKSCTYVLSSDFGPKLLSESSGAVGIAEGCKRTSIEGGSVEVSTWFEERASER